MFQRFNFWLSFILIIAWWPIFSFGQTTEYTHWSITKVGSWVIIGLETKIKLGEKFYTSQMLTYDWIVSGSQAVKAKTAQPFIRLQLQPGIKKILGQVRLIPKSQVIRNSVNLANKVLSFSLTVPAPRISLVTVTTAPDLTLPLSSKLSRGQTLQLIPYDFSSLDLDYSWTQNGRLLSTTKELVLDNRLQSGDVITATVKNRRDPREVATTELILQFDQL